MPLITTLLLAGFSPSPSLAVRGIDEPFVRDTRSCLAKAVSQVGHGGELCVRSTGDTTRCGRIIGFEEVEGGRVTLDGGDGLWTVGSRAVQAIRYRDDGIVRPLWVALGMASGIAGGVAMGHNAEGSSEFEGISEALGGIFGFVVGGIAGGVLSAVIPGEKTIRCHVVAD